MSSEVRQRKLNEQRQRIRENQNKKHIQQIKSIQKNDNEIRKQIVVSSFKDECSPLIKETSFVEQYSNKFAYDGPQVFELSSATTNKDKEVEIVHLNESKSSQTSDNERNVSINKTRDDDKDINSAKKPEKTVEVNIASKKTETNEDIEIEKMDNKNNPILPVQNKSNSNRKSGSHTDSSEYDLDSSANVSHVAVAPCDFDYKQSEISPSKDEDSLQHENGNGNPFQGFYETVLDSNIEIESFVTKPAPEECVIKCRITRDKHGVDKGMYPTYYLHLERKNTKPLFLLAARRRKLSTTSNYLISCDATDMKRDGFGFLAKLRANFIGTNFTLYDNGRNPQSKTISKKSIRKELAAIMFETNVLGFKGPRKMTIIIPGMTQKKSPIDFQPKANEADLLECCRTRKLDNLLELHNKKPMWNEDSQSYVLNFHGRVTQASVKNFQIIHENDAEYIIMQFGRTSDHSFSMDFAYPLSAIQAFGIALSSFDGKLACE